MRCIYIAKDSQVTGMLRAQHTAPTKDPLEGPYHNPSPPPTSRQEAQSGGGPCPRSYSENQELNPCQGLQGPFFAHGTHMCICLWVLIPSKGPAVCSPLLPTLPVPRNLQFLTVLLISHLCILLAVPCAEMPFLYLRCPLHPSPTWQTPTHTSGPSQLPPPSRNLP